APSYRASPRLYSSLLRDPTTREGMLGLVKNSTQPTSLSHHEHRAGREVHDAVRAAAHHAVVERRVTARPHHEQVGLPIAGEVDNVAHRMTGDDMGLERDLKRLRHLA